MLTASPHAAAIPGPRPPHTPALVALLLSLLALTFPSGCTAVPRESIARYRQAFDLARQAGETLLADYALAAPRAASPDATAAASDASAADPHDHAIRTRLLAWSAAASYHAALHDLAEGQPPARTGRAIADMLTDLRAMPLGAAALAADSIAPGAHAAAPIIDQLDRLHRRQQLRQLILSASPIFDSFYDQLLEDADHFARIRAIQFTDRRRQLVSHAADILAASQRLARQLDPANAQQDIALLHQLSLTARSIPGLASTLTPQLIPAPPATIAPPGHQPTPPTIDQAPPHPQPAHNSELTRLVRDLDALADQIETIDAQARSHARLIRHYTSLLRALRSEQQQLCLQLQGRPAPTDIALDLARLTAALRHALLLHQHHTQAGPASP